jgi:phosphatidylglycerol---prolipoprotein diacylglyceryl transferase
MFPELFRIPGLNLPINSYGFCIMVGFLLASWIAVRRGKPLGLSSDFILDVGIIGMIFGILGAKINYLLQYSQDFTRDSGMPLWADSGLNPIGVLVFGPIPFAFWLWRMKSAGEKVRLLTWQNGVLLLLTLLFAFLGARGVFLWQHQDEYSWRVFRNWQSGFVLYGGLLAGIPAGALYIKMRGQSISRIADLAAGPMMLALAFGRLGCFLNGCCHGQKGDSWLCVTFPPNSPAAQKGQNPAYPTQLFEVAAAVGFFFILSWAWRRKRKVEGEVFALMILLYSSWRFLIEFFRGDERPIWVAGLSYSQVVSVLAFAGAGLWMLLMRRRASETPPPTPAAQAPAA